ncbi:MAG: tetratricopeptide repeat protein [Magnetovibrionaceae bacterium]
MRTLGTLSALALSVILAFPAAADAPMVQRFKAYAVYKMGQYDEARAMWERMAEDGDPDAWFNLGTLAEDGLGEPRDLDLAKDRYRTGAIRGSGRSQYRLGLLMACADPPEPEALDWFAKASAQGMEDAEAWALHLAKGAERPSDCP